MTRKSFPRHSESRSKEILDLIHSDICGPMKTLTPAGNKYILTFIDDFSRYTTVYLLKNKGEMFSKYQQFAENMKTKFNKNIKCLRSDNGGEYLSDILDKYLKKNGTKHEFTAPYTPEQNGVAERKNRSLTEMANCMLIDANIDKKFWGEAVITANYLQNRLPTRAHDKTPFEIWNKRKPKLSYMKIFGCDAYVHIPRERRKKFDEKAIKLKFVGYSEESKAYRLLNTKTCQVTISRDVNFIEEDNTRNQENLNEQKVEDDDFNEDIEIALFNDDKCKTIEMNRSNNIVEHLTDQEDQEVIEKFTDPKTFKEAISSTEKNNWMEAMREEIDSMYKNRTWELVKPPNDRQTISCKWVYKVKNDPINNTNRYKARLVARGFSQKYGEDYDEIFAPVVKNSTIRVLLTLCGIRKMEAKHFDVKTAFLNGDLQETIYMQQPEGFVDPEKPNYVCKLKKSIYGLKQAAKAWNDKINEVLLTNGFRRGEADNCLYSKKIENEWLYILIYVDDIIIASKSNQNIESTGKLLNKYFELKLLGDLKYYLGIEIEKDENGIYLIHQRNYINKLLKSFQLDNAKDSKIPFDTGYYKNIENGSKLMADVDIYKKAIGSLLYLSVNTRPDITVAVSILCRKTSNPTEKDWTEIKRIFKYLKATRNNKLKLGENNKENSLIGYADADWAGDSTDRKSTSGFVIMLHGSTIFWSSRKQSNVTLSTTEAEYVSLTELCQEMMWTQKLLVDLNEKVQNVKVYEDNQSTLKILDHNTGMKTRSKHIAVKYHFVRNIKRSGDILFEYCPTNEMVADIFTKPLSSNKLNYFKKCLGIINSEN